MRNTTLGGGALWPLAAALVFCPGALAGCGGRNVPASAGTSSADAQAQQRGEPETPAEAQRERRRVERTLRGFADAVEGRSVRAVLDLLAEDGFDDRARFEDQMTEFFRLSRELRVVFRQSTLEVKGQRGTAIVDAEMVYVRRGRTRQEMQRRERIQFDFVRTARGWKVSAITPRTFFLP